MTAWNEGRARLLAAAAAGLLASCSAGGRDPLLTYFNGDHDVSIRYPASWRADQRIEDGVWYRTFAAPAAAGQKPLSAALLVVSFEGSLDDFGRRYVDGQRVVSSRDEERQGARGRSFSLAAPDGSTRTALLLLKDGGTIYGFRAQGDPAAFGRSEVLLGEMAKSLTLEKTDGYVRFQDPRFRVSIRLPRSWPESRRFSGPRTLMVQFTSPAFVADKDGQTAHASLTLTVESLGADGGIDAFYNDTRLKLGSAFEVLSHKPWRDGYSDLLTAETPLTISRVKRFYRVAGGRGYGLAFEAREDVLPRASRWCDLIAGTLLIGDETSRLGEPKP